MTKCLWDWKFPGGDDGHRGPLVIEVGGQVTFNLLNRGMFALLSSRRFRNVRKLVSVGFMDAARFPFGALREIGLFDSSTVFLEAQPSEDIMRHIGSEATVMVVRRSMYKRKEVNRFVEAWCKRRDCRGALILWRPLWKHRDQSPVSMRSVLLSLCYSSRFQTFESRFCTTANLFCYRTGIQTAPLILPNEDEDLTLFVIADCWLVLR